MSKILFSPPENKIHMCNVLFIIYSHFHKSPQFCCEMTMCMQWVQLSEQAAFTSEIVGSAILATDSCVDSREKSQVWPPRCPPTGKVDMVG